MTSKLLREFCALEYNADTIKESREKNSGKIMLKGILQKADTKNQNGRLYPMQILKREVENYQKAVREKRALGELDHPESSTVSLDRVSHVIREMWWEGGDVHGTIEVLSTPKGKTLESILDSGITIGISSRGVGSTEKKEGLDVVQGDFTLICFDVVSEPSTPGAYLFAEGKEIDRATVQVTRSDRLWRAINDIVRK